MSAITDFCSSLSDPAPDDANTQSTDDSATMSQPVSDSQDDAQVCQQDADTSQEDAQSCQQDSDTSQSDAGQDNGQVCQDDSDTSQSDASQSDSSQYDGQSCQDDSGASLDDGQSCQQDSDASQNDSDASQDNTQVCQDNTDAGQDDAQVCQEDGEDTQDGSQSCQDDAETGQDEQQVCQDDSDTGSEAASDANDNSAGFLSGVGDMVSDMASDAYDAVTDTASSAYDAVSEGASEVYDGAAEAYDKGGVSGVVAKGITGLAGLENKALHGVVGAGVEFAQEHGVISEDTGQTIMHVEEAVEGVNTGIAGLEAGMAKMYVDPLGTFSDMGKAMGSAYDKAGGGAEGVLDAVNTVNPAYHAMVAVDKAYDAAERGDYKAMAEQGTNAVAGVLGTVGMAELGAGLADAALGGEGAAAAGAGAEGEAGAAGGAEGGGTKESPWEGVEKQGEAIENTRGELVGKTEEHHIFPQELEEYFESRQPNGIDIDEHVTAIDREVHKIVHGKGGFFEDYNTEWREWKEANPNATEQQVFEQAGKMMDKYGLSLGTKLKKYRK